VSGATDTADPDAHTDFTSSSQDRFTTTAVPLIEPAHIIALPKGQMFSFQEGGQLWKVRMPLPKPASDDAMPADLQTLAALMRESYNANAGSWWSSAGGAPTADFDPGMPPPGRRHAP
jgi:hypothetical protein